MSQFIVYTSAPNEPIVVNCLKGMAALVVETNTKVAKVEATFDTDVSEALLREHLSKALNGDWFAVENIIGECA